MKSLVKKIKSDKKDLHIQLPKAFINKDIRIIIEIDENKTEISKLLTDKISVDTKKWKFNRAEIYE